MDEYKNRVKSLEKKLRIDEKKDEIAKIEKESSKQEFWIDHETAAKKMQKLTRLQKTVEKITWLKELADAGESSELDKELGEFEKETYLSGPYFDSDAVLSIHAGQGGTEAMDWTEMLFRMYTRYIENKKWKWSEVDKKPGEEAGLKSVTIEVKGDFAYGSLQAESGVHRLVRQSPFNADKLRQTSFALVEVLPVLTSDDNNISVTDDEIEWSFFRASGPGGQNVNKVSTAVRLKHKPTNLVVTSQSQRSQHQNRETALAILKSKLWRLEEVKRSEKEEKLKGQYKKPGWGNQIRSYVLHPYKMVKDLRTETETSQVDKVLNGEIDQFIDSYLKMHSEL